MKLILLRGPSGTGKSTIARHLVGDSQSFDVGISHETDRFFMDESGIYRFNATLIGKAHEWNQQEVRKSMLCEYPVVVVSNTFITHWEMKSYLDMAKELGYEVEFIRTPGPWEADILFGRNKHGVPMDVVKRQINRYQPHENDKVWSDMSIFNE